MLSWSFLLLFLRKFAAFYLGCAACWWLQGQWQVPSMVASATVGLLGTFIPVPERFDRQGIQAAIFTGSFAGMCSHDLLNNQTKLLLASVIGALLFILARPHYQGFGGRLGVVAFAVSLLLLALSHFFK